MAYPYVRPVAYSSFNNPRRQRQQGHTCTVWLTARKHDMDTEPTCGLPCTHTDTKTPFSVSSSTSSFFDSLHCSQMWPTPRQTPRHLIDSFSSVFVGRHSTTLSFRLLRFYFFCRSKTNSADAFFADTRRRCALTPTTYSLPHFTSGFSPPRYRFPPRFSENGPTLDGSCSSVSRPIFVTKDYFLEFFSRSTGFTHLCTFGILSGKLPGEKPSHRPKLKIFAKIVKLFSLNLFFVFFARFSAKILICR